MDATSEQNKAEKDYALVAKDASSFALRISPMLRLLVFSFLFTSKIPVFFIVKNLSIYLKIFLNNSCILISEGVLSI